MESNHLYRCPCCDYFALKLTLVVAYLGAVHSAEPNFRVNCGVGDCSEVYTKVTSYRTHLYRLHRDALFPANVRDDASQGENGSTTSAAPDLASEAGAGSSEEECNGT